MSKNHITVVVPVYACSASLRDLYDRLICSLSDISDKFEIILINDDSPDDAWEMMKALSSHDERVKAINLSRNFGQHQAITAGLDHSSGDWVVVMDCDLQDRPEEIIKLYTKAIEGYDVVFGRRSQRKDSYFKRLGSKVFYKVYDYFTESKTDNTIANFSIISSNVVDKLRLLREQNRTYPLFVNWLGFKKAYVDIEHAQRLSGKSSYTLNKMINLAIDSIISQSNKPLKLSIKFGFLLSFSSLSFALWLVVRYLVYSVPVPGWTSVMVSMYFIGGLLFANMGVLGLYIGKTFDETKNRPLYIIKEKTF